MEGRKFLNPAKVLAARTGEEYGRAAVGRAYYALMLECREAFQRWGFVIPRRDNVHTFLRLRFCRNGNHTLETIGDALTDLGQLRNTADYETSALGLFTANVTAQRAIQKAQDTIALLDGINTDSNQQNAAIAALRQA